MLRGTVRGSFDGLGVIFEALSQGIDLLVDAESCPGLLKST